MKGRSGSFSTPVLLLRPPSSSPSPLSSEGSKKPQTLVEWLPLQNHPVFTDNASATRLSSPGGGGGGRNPSTNLASWDAASSRLYLWDPVARCVHRLCLRFTDPDPDPDADSSLVEAASPSEKLMPDIQLQTVFHYASLNEDGSSLVLAGSDSLCLMYLYEKTSMYLGTMLCRTVIVGSQIFPGSNNGLQILQVSWHPYSSNHLGVLSSDSVFRLFNLSSDLEQPEQELYLQPVDPGRCENALAICPVAFSFGGQHLWDRFSVFILFSDGSVYVLCPVVPFGSLCSWACIKEIYEDINMFGLKSSDAKVISNSNQAVDWLESTFPELANQSTDESNMTVSKARPYAPINASLSLQGPLSRVCHGDEIDDSKIWSDHCEGRAVSLLYSSIGKDSVLTIAWSSGQLQVDALADEVQPLWKSGSSSHIHVDNYGHIKGVAMICESNLQELPIGVLSHPSQHVNNTTDTVWLGHPPPLLRLAVVDLALPKCVLESCLLSLFPDPLVSERFCCLHGGGIDLITLHFLPFSSLNLETDKIEKAPSVCPILSTCPSESCTPSVLCGFVTVADSYGNSVIIGISPTYECIVLEINGWNDIPPFQYDIDVKLIGSTEVIIPDIISKELLAGPKITVVPSASLRSVTADSIEGRSSLHHYIKLFHENYVEYAHKVYIELEQHGDYLRTIIDDQNKRLHEARQSLFSVKEKEQDIEDRINRAFKVYELLEQRLQNFKRLPGPNKKPLTRAEREFSAELDRFADLELDALRSSIEALNARLKRFIQSAPSTTSNIARQAQGRKDRVSDSQILQLKSSLESLSLVNNQNTRKVKLIEHELKSRE